MDATIRSATAGDAGACLALYRPYVLDTAISFELEPPPVAEFARRIAASHAWLVAVDSGVVVGYAYGSPHRERAAYRFAADVSVYLAPAVQGRGLGRSLYTALFDQLASCGITTVLAGATLPNPASLALHRALGFETVGVYRRVGWKFGRWHDTCWMQRFLVEDDGPPAIDQ